MLEFNVTKDISNLVNRTVRDYINKDGKAEIRKQIDIALKQRDEVNKQKQSLRQNQIEKINGVYGRTILNNVQATHSNDSLLQDMKNKITYGVTPDSVSQNNGSINYKGY